MVISNHYFMRNVLISTGRWASVVYISFPPFFLHLTTVFLSDNKNGWFIGMQIICIFKNNANSFSQIYCYKYYYKHDSIYFLTKRKFTVILIMLIWIKVYNREQIIIIVTITIIIISLWINCKISEKIIIWITIIKLSALDL